MVHLLESESDTDINTHLTRDHVLASYHGYHGNIPCMVYQGHYLYVVTVYAYVFMLKCVYVGNGRWFIRDVMRT